MKTIQDYLNDPRITGDLGLMRGPEEIRTIHAIRLKQQDETAGMSFEEKEALHRKRTDAMFDSLGLPLPLYVNFAGQGKLKPRAVSAAGV
ncbi:hypothetical protein AGMMS50230_19640 [Spirochaetia bacterium]|nr:hypothetical protein AGMMS50230_19640 [Spirochaetia bacterium]